MPTKRKPNLADCAELMAEEARLRDELQRVRQRLAREISQLLNGHRISYATLSRRLCAACSPLEQRQLQEMLRKRVQRDRARDSGPRNRS